MRGVCVRVRCRGETTRLRTEARTHPVVAKLLDVMPTPSSLMRTTCSEGCSCPSSSNSMTTLDAPASYPFLTNSPTARFGSAISSRPRKRWRRAAGRNTRVPLLRQLRASRLDSSKSLVQGWGIDASNYFRSTTMLSLRKAGGALAEGMFRRDGKRATINSSTLNPTTFANEAMITSEAMTKLVAPWPWRNYRRRRLLFLPARAVRRDQSWFAACPRSSRSRVGVVGGGNGRVESKQALDPASGRRLA